MAVEIMVSYKGQLHTEAVHGPSGRVLETDAPVDNQGRGESFSPTDLVATSLGTCMLTIMGIAARERGIDMEGATVKVTKEMIADPQRRIHRLSAVVTMPHPLPEKERKILERAGLTCPTHVTLGDRVEKPVEFIWPSE
jgi:putative redox protein